MIQPRITLHADTSAAEAFLSEVRGILSRRGSLPEFLERIVDIRNLLPKGLEFALIGDDFDSMPASTGNLFYSVNVAQPLLDRLAALRALDRDFDLIGQAHG